MKSKAHSKKCMEMGLPEGLTEDQDAEDSGTEFLRLLHVVNLFNNNHRGAVVLGENVSFYL